MQEVCNNLETPVLGGSGNGVVGVTGQQQPQIKSETTTTPLQCIPNMQQTPPIQAVPGAAKVPVSEKQHADSSYWMPTESGFINSQPSMAEFLTHVEPESPGKLGAHPAYTNTPIVGDTNCSDAVPEYPWMKEKKTSRKNNSQGRFAFCMNSSHHQNTRSRCKYTQGSICAYV